MLTISDLTYRIDGRALFDQASARIPEGHKVGIVGRNGTGKTTLFRLIRGEIAPESGEISIPKRARIGGVAQEAPASDISLLETVLQADTERARLLREADEATDPMEIAEIQMRLADIDAYSAEARAGAILSGLGFNAEAQQRPCKDFSGGWRMRVALAAVLFSAPDLLLLDEPTNYLDLEGTMWLENFIARYPHSALIISHDRQLLNRAVTGILHLEDRNLTYYAGNYDEFARRRAAQREQQAAAKKKQDATRAHLQSYVDRFRYKASKAKQAQSRLKMLEKMEVIADVVETGVAAFNFPSPTELSPPILRLEDVAVGYGDRKVLHHLNLRIDPDDRIALLGANGQGKSTFAKLLAERLDPMEGDITRASKLKIGYFAQHQLDELRAEETPIQHLARALPDLPPAKLRARLASSGIPNAIADNKVRDLSGGQKARLAMLLAMIDAPHLILLDEPTNHLDMESREALIMALNDYEGAVIVISHDPHLLGAVADRLWLVKGGAVTGYEGDLDTYRRLLLSERGGQEPGAKAAKQAKPEPTPAKPAPKPAASKSDRKSLEKAAAEAEARLEKLDIMRLKLDAHLANPKLYDPDNLEKTREMQEKHAELMRMIEKAEDAWMQAQNALDAADREAG
ncbi:ABC-F family ATP-binding cassette domain-containing protein [Paracoccaceae bacterium GXU_MW_L88]